MANPSLTVTLILCFIAVSYAFTPLDLPQSDVYTSIPHDVVESESTESNTVQTRDDLPSSQIFIVDHVTLTRPATIGGFRPINRHFNVKQQFGLRLPLRGCDHHKKRLHGRREVSYGNDMILAEGGNHHHHRYHDRNGLPEFPFEGEVEYKPTSDNQENRLTNKIRKFLNHF
jgi:hypothetical protein